MIGRRRDAAADSDTLASRAAMGAVSAPDSATQVSGLAMTPPPR